MRWRSLTVMAIANLLTWSAPVRGTGIELAIGAAWAALGAVGQGIVINLAISAVIAVASYGLSYIISRNGQQQQLAQSQGQQDSGGGFNIRLPEFSGVAAARRAYGLFDCAGVVFFHKTVAVGGSAPNHWIFGQLYSEGVCEGPDALIINGQVCNLDIHGNPTTRPWYDEAGNKLTVSFRSGRDDQGVDPIILARFPAPPDDFYPDASDRVTRWANFKNKGISTIVLDLLVGSTQEEHTELWGTGGVPEIKARFRGLQQYDRDDPLQDPDDPDTWTWTDNATISSEDIAVAEIGAQAARSDIEPVQTRESIKIDKEWVPTLAGNERRGRVNGIVNSDEAPVDMISSMLQMNRGAVRITEGKIVIRSDRPAVPVATISRRQWRGPLDMQNQPDARSLMRGIVSQYYPLPRFGEAAEVAYPATAMDDPAASRIGYRFGVSSPGVQRLNYAMLSENQVARTIAGRFHRSVLVAPGKSNRLLEDGDCIWFDGEYPYDDMDGTYNVAELNLGSDFYVTLSLVGTDPMSILGWSTALETAA